jgi:small-conductance mechanosensitive channel
MEAISAVTETINEWFAAIDLENPLWATTASVVVTVFIFLLFRAWRLVTKRFQANLDGARTTWIKPLRFQRLDLLSADDIAGLLMHGVQVAYSIGVVFLILLNVNVIFGIFPATRGWAAALMNVFRNAGSAMGSQFIDYLPKLMVIILTAAIAYYAIRLARLVFHGLATRRITVSGFYPEWAMPTFSLVRLLIIAVAFVLILPNLPAAQSSAFRGVSIFVAVLVSLGSTAAVANMVAGVVLTYTRAFRIGDRVRIADTVGNVEEKSLFVTRVTTPKNVEIAIPNAMVLANHVVNFSARARTSPGLILHTTVTIGYDIPKDTVTQLLIEAARSTQEIESDPEPFVLITNLDDFYISYEINAYTKRARPMASTYSELHSNIVDRFNQAGVEIMSPHYSAIRDGNRLAIPDDHLPTNYKPVPFRVHPFEGFFGRKKDS